MDGVCYMRRHCSSGWSIEFVLHEYGEFDYGASTPLFVHCGAVIGGTSLMGGVGGIPQTFLGLLALAVAEHAFNMLGISSYLQLLLQGIIILAILWMNSFGIKLKRETV